MQVFGTVVLNLAFTAEQAAPVFFLVVEAVGVDGGLSTQVDVVDIGNDIAVCRNACAVSAQIAFGNQTDITGCGDFGLMGGRVFGRFCSDTGFQGSSFIFEADISRAAVGFAVAAQYDALLCGNASISSRVQFGRIQLNFAGGGNIDRTGIDFGLMQAFVSRGAQVVVVPKAFALSVVGFCTVGGFYRVRIDIACGRSSQRAGIDVGCAQVEAAAIVQSQ